MTDVEKLGYFYLGRRHDLEAGTTLDEPVLYDSRDLTTHAVCIGMTGSGKTGLCVSLLEEAAIDGIPALVIDPKGDLGNLLLTFPRLDAASFRPWIDESAAARRGASLDEEAERTAASWREGLAKWGQDGARIERLRAAADAVIYTPGSSAGRELGILGCLAAPAPETLADAESLAERVETAAASLLSLLGKTADPLQSREHVLLATIFQNAWEAGQALDVAELVRRVQKPPFDRVGALALESFYPADDRFQLAIALNNLIASPAFEFWNKGEPLDIDRLLHTRDGKPRLAILSISHLAERERMFVVTLVLNEFLAWVRRQPGSQSLRAVLYMDEVFGYLPPTANPSSKKPLLTLLKQARAHGIGVVLATQNPVDLDYKALSNAGTWFLGRLQTERDKTRVLDGLEAVAGRTTRADLDKTLSSLGKRVFLLHDVHEDVPVVFHTRWALSYLAGPLSREQIGRLKAGDAGAADDEAAPKPDATPRTRERPSSTVAPSTRPVVEPGVREVFVAACDGGASAEAPCYRPSLLARARVHFVHTQSQHDSWRTFDVLGDLDPSDPAWRDAADELDDVERLNGRTRGDPAVGASFGELPEGGARAASYKKWERHLRTWIHRERRLEIWQAPGVKMWSEAGEQKGDFAARVRMRVREERDQDLEKTRERYASKIATLHERIRRAEQKVERERDQYESARSQTAISLGATVLGALFGRKLGSATTLGRATSTMRGAGRAAQQRADIDRAREDVAALNEQVAELERELEGELDRIAREHDETAAAIEAVEVAPRKSDIEIESLRLAWLAD